MMIFFKNSKVFRGLRRVFKHGIQQITFNNYNLVTCFGYNS